MKKIHFLLISVPLFAFDPLFTTNNTTQILDSCIAVNQKSSLTLPEALQIALCNDPKTKKAYAATMQSAANLGVSRSAYLPNASATAQQPIFNETQASNSLNRNMGINVSWLLYDFGQTSNAVLNAYKLLESANFSLTAEVQNVFLRTIQDYCLVLAAQEAVDAAKLSQKAAYESFLAASAKFEAGTVTIADKLQAQTAWSQAQLALTTSEGDLVTAQVTFASDIGEDASKEYELAPLPQPKAYIEQDAKIKQTIKQATAARPDVLSALKQVEAAKASVTQNERAYLPSINVGGQLGYKDTYLFPPPNNSVVSVSLNLPIFNGFATHYKIRSAREGLNTKQSDYEYALKQATLGAYKAYNALITKTKTLENTKILLESATKSEQIARGRYEAGVGTMTDLLNAQSTLASARMRQIKAELDMRTAKAELAYNLGILSIEEVQKELK